MRAHAHLLSIVRIIGRADLPAAVSPGPLKGIDLTVRFRRCQTINADLRDGVKKDEKSRCSLPLPALACASDNTNPWRTVISEEFTGDVAGGLPSSAYVP